ncbi:hypothetical protein niasHS_006509 [Heterodera schachtii]|uniref:DNA polymerase alpha subunit B n=1 Tax=Heterodera schachtii TaxID=97005 RepID=A0ABD2JHL0_HETSC
MTPSTDETHFGGMDRPFVQAHLDQFNCALGAEDELDEIVNKINALCTTHSIGALDFLDGLIAFMKNGKRTTVSMQILDNYEHQVLLRMNDSEKRRKATKRTAPLDYRKEREVLKELPFYADLFAAANIGTDEPLLDDSEECGVLQQNAEFDAFDDDQNYAPQPKMQKTSNSSSAAVHLPVGNGCAVGGGGFVWPAKSSFTGAAFVAGGANCGQSAAMPNLRVISKWEENSGEKNDDGLDEVENQASSSSSPLLVGTICPTEGNSLSFQNASLSTGTRVFSLDFGHVDNISIYPGMKMAAKCTVEDCHGQQLCRMQSVVEPPMLEMPKLEPIGQQPNTRLKVVIARGPFFSGIMAHSADQFVQLLSSVAASGANALILFGPFVPQGMELMTDSPEAIFSDLLVEIDQHIPANVRVLIVPNAQCDQLNALPSFPTPPLIAPQNDTVPNNVTFLSDPALFELDSVHFAVSSSEILLHLCKTEICKSANVENEDRMRRLISHLFRARSLYPLCPCDQNLPFAPSASANAKLRLPTKPHVMVLPSLLQPVTKVVDDCVVLNPGRFDRGKGTGTFSVLDLDLSSAVGATSISPFCEVSLFSTQQQQQ